MAKCLNVRGEIYDNGKDCYAVVFDCRPTENYKTCVVVGPLIDAWQLPDEDRKAHNVLPCASGAGLDVVWYYDVPRGGPVPASLAGAVPTLATESIWEASLRFVREHEQASEGRPDTGESYHG